jgi:pyridoxal phosphate enzyme (YggS family)
MSIADNLKRLQDDIAEAIAHAGRPAHSVRLVAASKGQPASALREAAAAGQRIFGESYAREMRQKRSEIGVSSTNIEWHFIGRVQVSNAKEISTAALVHGVGSMDQAQGLAKRGPIPVLLQLSLWNEETKNGFSLADLERNLPLLREVRGLEIRGFMAMPPPGAPARAAFAAVRATRDALAPDLAELSMGMSGDFRDAIAEGATLVRIGTALFGARP